jgi:diguanylate cyclase (GGDEF)-like protein
MKRSSRCSHLTNSEGPLAMTLRVLLVESEPQDVIFLSDALTEIEAGRFWNTWVHIETFHAATWKEASAVLGNEAIDLILLDLDIADSHGVETFRLAQTVAERIPVVLLIGPNDQAMAARMIREGAQDFLIKKQVDCAPLAHAILNAIERHRLLAAMRAGATADSLTSLPNRSSFLTVAERDRKLAERLSRRLMILVAEPRNLGEPAGALGEQRRDLAMVEAADHLRSLAGLTDLVARIGDTRFGVAVFETDVESLEEVWVRIHSGALSHQISVGAAIFDSDRPVTLDVLLEHAELDLTPNALAMHR